MPGWRRAEMAPRTEGNGKRVSSTLVILVGLVMLASYPYESREARPVRRGGTMCRGCGARSVGTVESTTRL